MHVQSMPDFARAFPGIASRFQRKRQTATAKAKTLKHSQDRQSKQTDRQTETESEINTLKTL